MFKNRLRTAALAGAIAVATGISGLAVPAYAQVNEGGFSTTDGSAQQNVTPQNITENQLRTQTGATAVYLNSLQNGTLEEIVADYMEVTDSEDGFDPSEEAALAAYDAARTAAAAQLVTNAQNIQDARASVAFALEADKQAEDDWDAFVTALQAAVTQLNPLITATNDANRHQVDFAIIDLLDTPVTRENAVEVLGQLTALKAEVDAQYSLAGDWNIDVADDEYVSREHIAALQALKDATDARVEAVTEAYETAKASNIEAQKSDVLVRQLFLERATAQRDTLRVVEAAFSVAGRYVELYNDDQLVNDSTTLRQQYGSLIDNLFVGLGLNLADLAAADEAAEDGFLIWESDLRNNDDEEQYFIDKVEFATKTYAKIFLNGAVWQNEVSRVELLDKSVFDKIDAEEAAREQEAADRAAAEKAAEEAKKREEERNAALDAIAKELAKDNNTPAPIENGSTGSSENTGIIGLIAAIGGIVGLIAIAFPFLQDFLR